MKAEDDLKVPDLIAQIWAADILARHPESFPAAIPMPTLEEVQAAFEAGFLNPADWPYPKWLSSHFFLNRFFHPVLWNSSLDQVPRLWRRILRDEDRGCILDWVLIIRRSREMAEAPHTVTIQDAEQILTLAGLNKTLLYRGLLSLGFRSSDADLQGLLHLGTKLFRTEQLIFDGKIKSTEDDHELQGQIIDLISIAIGK